MHWLAYIDQPRGRLASPLPLLPGQDAKNITDFLGPNYSRLAGQNQIGSLFRFTLPAKNLDTVIWYQFLYMIFLKELWKVSRKQSKEKK